MIIAYSYLDQYQALGLQSILSYFSLAQAVTFGQPRQELEIVPRTTAYEIDPRTTAYEIVPRITAFEIED